MAAMLKKITMSGACMVVGVVCRRSSRTLLGGVHSYSTKKTGRGRQEQVTEVEIKKSVFVSQSTDIFTNLALEDWLYKNHDFSHHHIMMVWKSDPCIVVGKHQNPWKEANLNLLKEKEIVLARRSTGGGAVYHDRGNLNVTFFIPRESYNRMYNLEVIKRAVYREFGIKIDTNERQDLVLNGKFKVSGTASKLGRLSAYHHCTLLVNSNKTLLSQSLATSEQHGIQTKATPSVRSSVKNLAEVSQRISVEALQTALGWEYLRTPAMHLEDGEHDLISKQHGFQMINPTDEWFPGLDAIKNELQSWDWCYGKTPGFTVHRSFLVPSELLQFKNYAAPQELVINMTVERGLIDDVTLSIPPGLMESGFHGEASVVTQLKGKRFTDEALEAVETAMLDSHEERPRLDRAERFVAECFDQLVNAM